MKLLYLDTSTNFLYCGLVQDDILLFEIKKRFDHDLSKHCLFEIKSKFNEFSIDPRSIDKIILVNGPGSFTGVRIACTIAKTYAWALNIPVIVISSLLAMVISCDKSADFYVPLINARRNNCFCAIYDSSLNCILREQFTKLDVLQASVKNLGDNFVFISNDDYYFEHEKYNPNILKIVNTCRNNKSVENPHLINANYLKLTEAEEKLNDSID